MWVSDTSSHSKNRALAQLPEEVKVGHQFAVACSLWSNGTCERMIREVTQTLKSIVSEEDQLASE